ncbi:MAG: acetolactate synthase small subunit [Clostridiaceae bacterium]|jgi:acetolactate synthase-1/3 small subunit|nr:acetolactate synthase small subunit [Bacillota bacterium]NLN51514.1 acetolactate synthase small subunit [Clostridiaceae bacterium]
MKQMRVLSILVENNAGTLTRVAGLFARRGYNIDTLTVSETKDPSFSRITLTASLNDLELNQLVSQTAKLEEVISIEELFETNSVMREILLVKVSVSDDCRSKLIEITDVYKGVVVDLSPDSMIIELTGKPQKIDAFIRVIDNYNIVNICRTGVTALQRGKGD